MPEKFEPQFSETDVDRREKSEDKTEDRPNNTKPREIKVFQMDKDEKNELEKGKELEESTEIFDEKIEELLGLVENSAKEILTPTLLKRRMDDARNSIWVVSKDRWKELCLQEEGGGGLFIGGLVVTTPKYYGKEDQIGKVVMKYENSIENDAEFMHTLLHELIHKAGQEIKITKYPQIRQNEDQTISTTQVEYCTGPLKVTLENRIPIPYLYTYTELKLIPGKTVQYWQEIPYRSVEKEREYSGEVLLWEAITDWLTDKIFTEIKPDFATEHGYQQKAPIEALVLETERRGGKEIRKAIKEGLFNGDNTILKKTLETHYGKGAYERLCEIIRISEDNFENIKKNFIKFIKNNKSSSIKLKEGIKSRLFKGKRGKKS